MPRLAMLTTLAVAIAFPAGALGAARVWIEGSGFGHGIGLSQEGARGFAEHGFNYRQILRHYYRGTPWALCRPGAGCGCSCTPAAPAVSAAPATSAASSSTRADLHRGGDAGRTAGDRAAAAAPWPAAARPCTCAGRGRSTWPAARTGARWTSPAAGGVQVVNTLALEDYVRGVVSAESPSSWPIQELKAQAVAARAYAVTTSHGGAFDQYADTRSQVYKGVGAETARTDAAVRATRGQVVTYRGRAVTSYFFAASGGHTENVEDSFVGSSPKPWLKGVPDPYERGAPMHTWHRGPYTRAARREAGRLGEGLLRRCACTRRGASPRIVRAVVVGTRGRTRVTGPDLKARLGLPDSWATFVDVSTRALAGGAAAVGGRGRRRRASRLGPGRRARCGGRWRRGGRAPGWRCPSGGLGAGASRARRGCGAAGRTRRSCRGRGPTGCAAGDGGPAVSVR